MVTGTEALREEWNETHTHTQRVGKYTYNKKKDLTFNVYRRLFKLTKKKWKKYWNGLCTFQAVQIF